MALPKMDDKPGVQGFSAADLLDHYLNFLRSPQGLAEATIVLRRLHVAPFLQSLERRASFPICAASPRAWWMTTSSEPANPLLARRVSIWSQLCAVSFVLLTLKAI